MCAAGFQGTPRTGPNRANSPSYDASSCVHSARIASTYFLEHRPAPVRGHVVVGRPVGVPPEAGTDLDPAAGEVVEGGEDLLATSVIGSDSTRNSATAVDSLIREVSLGDGRERDPPGRGRAGSGRPAASRPWSGVRRRPLDRDGCRRARRACRSRAPSAAAAERGRLDAAVEGEDGASPLRLRSDQNTFHRGGSRVRGVYSATVPPGGRRGPRHRVRRAARPGRGRAVAGARAAQAGEVHELDARVGGRIRMSLTYDDPVGHVRRRDRHLAGAARPLVAGRSGSSRRSRSRPTTRRSAARSRDDDHAPRRPPWHRGRDPDGRHAGRGPGRPQRGRGEDGGGKLARLVG